MASIVGTVRLILMYVVGLFWTWLVLLQVLRLVMTKHDKFFYKKDRKYPPSCLSNPELGRHCHVRLPTQGVRLHYVESGENNQPVVLMLHGFPEFWYSWRHQITLLNTTHRVIAVDMRGYGGSSKPTAIHKYQLSELVEDMRELIETLGLGPCTILGHDWGGAVTWGLAGQYPHLVDKVVIMNCPHPGAFHKFMGKSWKQFIKSWYMFLVVPPYFPEWFYSTGDLKMLDNTFTGRGMGAQPGAFTSGDIEAYKHTFNSMWDFTGPMNYYRAALTQLANRSEILKMPRGGGVIEVPVLLLWGTRDGALSNEMAELSRDFAKDFQLEWIEGASHWVQQDEPQIVNQYISEFLDTASPNLD